jgi:hypothetical protein
METLINDDDTYDITVGDIEKAGGYEVTTHTEEHGPVAGHKVRRMFERAAVDHDRPFWVGYDDTARGGFREVPIEFDALKRHLWVSGTTGAGKTTVLQNKAVQHAFGNHGFCNIDPKADGDTVDLLRMLPSWRLDDVVFLEPGSSEFEKIIGINLLDVPPIQDKIEREKEVENRLENLTAIFDNDEYWGPTMASITESMGRAMLRKNAMLSLDDDADPEDKYSVIDMYFILLSKERREQFAQQVDDQYLQEFLGQIAEMDDEQVRPLLKRIKRWVENPVIRKIVAQRESTVDWDSIVDDNKILLVRIPIDSEDVHQMITLTVMRNIWSAKKRQIRADDREKKPYFMQVDEFEKVANDNLAMDSMLARARSFWLSVTLGTQYPEQIKKDHEPILRAMENNCGTLLAMQTPGSIDARLLVKRFIDIDPEDLTNTNRYRCWTRIPLEDGRESEPLNVKTFPPYPPLHGEEMAAHAIRHSLDNFGTTPITESEIHNNLKAGKVGEIINPASAGGPDIHTDTNQNMSLDMVPEETFLEAIFSAAIQYNGEDEPVPQSKVEAELKKRVGEVGFGSEVANKFEKDEYVKVEGRTDGDVTVTLTETGLNKALSHDTGSSASGGKEDHREVLRKSYKLFTKIGALTSLPTQEGDELPDGVADLPHDPLKEAESVDEAVEIQERMKQEYPILYELGNGRDIAIEAETSTIKKPMQTLTNLRKAIESDRTCLFACKDASGDDVDSHDITHWPRRGEQIIHPTNNGGVDRDSINCVSTEYENGDRKFYNKTSKLKVEPGRVVVVERPDDHNETEWREQDNKVVAISHQKGGESEELTSFNSLELAVDPPLKTTLHREKKKDQWVVKKGEGEDASIMGRYGTKEELSKDYMDLYTPFIPDVEFPREVRCDDFDFIVFPDDDSERYEECQLYLDGELVPLSGVEYTPDDSPKAATNGHSSETSVESTTDDDTTAGDESTNDHNPEASMESTNGHASETSVESTTESQTEAPENEGQSTADNDSDQTEESRSKYEYTPAEEIPASATVTPKEIKEEIDRNPKLEHDVELETIKAFATGTLFHDPDIYRTVYAAIKFTNKEAHSYVNRIPYHIPSVLGSVGSYEPDEGPDTDTLSR